MRVVVPSCRLTLIATAFLREALNRRSNVLGITRGVPIPMLRVYFKRHAVGVDARVRRFLRG